MASYCTSVWSIARAKGEGNTPHTILQYSTHDIAILPFIPHNKVMLLMCLRISLADFTGQYNLGNMEKFLLSVVYLLLGNMIR